MVFREMITGLKSRLSRLSIFQRIAIGNGLVIIVATVTGILLTKTLADHSVEWELILLLVGVVVAICIFINSLIVTAALLPLRDLGRLAKRLSNSTNKNLVPPLDGIENPDPFTARMATTLHSLFVHLEERNEELRALSERAITAQEAERKAIAQSLHDDTGQALTMLAIHLDRIDERIPKQNKVLKMEVAEARLLTSNALTELRRILSGLRPSILDDLGLVPAIRWYARTNLEAAGVHVFIFAPNIPVDLSPPLSTTLFRIAQEAINNIVRHAQATTASITLQMDDQQVELRVEDNGIGFDQERVSQDAVQANQLGLVGVRERAQLLGGKLTIESIPGKGSQLLAIIPLDLGGGDHDGQN